MKTIDLKLQPEHFKIIVDGLESIPYKIAAPILADINAQLQAQKQVLEAEKKDK